jgi:hypothetical protein
MMETYFPPEKDRDQPNWKERIGERQSTPQNGGDDVEGIEMG